MQNQKRKINKSFYAYSVEFDALVAGSARDNSFNIEADSNFLLQEITYFSSIQGLAQIESNRIIPLIRLLITNTGSGRQFMDADQPLTNIAGTGERPFILPKPKIFTARSKVLVKATNVSGATNYDTIISFVGTKLYNDYPINS